MDSEIGQTVRLVGENGDRLYITKYKAEEIMCELKVAKEGLFPLGAETAG